MNAFYTRMEMWRPYILSILRIVVGLLFLQHGLSKVFNFPAPSPVAFAERSPDSCGVP